MLKNKVSYKYKTPANVMYELIQFLTNSMFAIKIGTTMEIINTHKIILYKYK